jgi:hypothetical protein
MMHHRTLAWKVHPHGSSRCKVGTLTSPPPTASKVLHTVSKPAVEKA